MGFLRIFLIPLPSGHFGCQTPFVVWLCLYRYIFIFCVIPDFNHVVLLWSVPVTASWIPTAVLRACVGIMALRCAPWSYVLFKKTMEKTNFATLTCVLLFYVYLHVTIYCAITKQLVTRFLSINHHISINWTKEIVVFDQVDNT